MPVAGRMHWQHSTAMLNTDKAWRKWGKWDPYFGVLADDRFSVANIEENREAFFVTGQHFISHILSCFERQFGHLNRSRTLDHGCGVGRLTLPLADQFRDVLALDVSPEMLAEATANAERSAVSNITFAGADDELSNAVGTFDFVMSHMVLQHVPVRRGMPLLALLVSKVAPGGGFHISLSMREEPLRWQILYWASANIPGVKIVQNVMAGRRWNAPAMQMNNYPLNRILALLADLSIKELVLRTENYGRFITYSLIGRRPTISGDSSHLCERVTARKFLGANGPLRPSKLKVRQRSAR